MEKTLKQHPSTLIKIVLFGPESTGKTTLSRQLAKHYNTVWAPEFAREYLQNKWDNEFTICQAEDIIPIAQGQIRLENEQAKKANQLLICDTNLLETKVYAEVYFKDYSNSILNNAVNEHHYDLYFLTYIDTPWEADDLRDKPNEREEMFHIFEKALKKYNKPYILLKGNKETRLQKAIAAINQLLEQKSRL